MRIFISWSGSRSLAIAEALRDWLPKVIQSLRPWISASDIDKGSRWLKEISENLEATNFGIICLTPENISAPWILFEAGALSKAIDNSHICPVLLGFDATSLQGPLSQFQATHLQKADMRKLLVTINKTLGENSLPEKQLEESFGMWWPRLETIISSIQADKDEKAPERSERELLEELLQIARRLDRGQDLTVGDIIISSLLPPGFDVLTPREEKVLRMRFGIGERKQVQPEVIANEFGISSDKVEEMTKSSIRKLIKCAPTRLIKDTLCDRLKSREDT
jgi:hypothetical protein